MAKYYFNLQTGGGLVPDRIGAELTNEEAARKHARTVARDLMRHRESKSRCWRLCVHQEGGEPCFEMLFAAVDETMDHLPPNIRQSVERVCWNAAGLTPCAMCACPFGRSGRPWRRPAQSPISPLSMAFVSDDLVPKGGAAAS